MYFPVTTLTILLFFQLLALQRDNLVYYPVHTQLTEHSKMKKITTDAYDFFRNHGGKFLEDYIQHHKSGLISDQEFVARCNAVTGQQFDAPVNYSAWSHVEGAAK